MSIAKNLFFSVLIILSLATTAFSQNQKYTIFWGDDEIGLMTVSRIKKGDIVDYFIKADVEFRVIVKYNRTTEFNAKYLRDTLVFCSSKSVMNDNLKIFESTNKDGDLYRIFKHPEDSSVLRETITKSVAMLYYAEPTPDLKRIYAEGYSKFCQLEKVENGVYLLHLTEDKTNIYRYENGRLKEVEVKRTWFDLTFKRQS